MIQTLNQWDINLFLFLNGLHSSFWDPFMYFISGIPQWIPLYIILIYFVIKKFKLKAVYILLTLVLLIVLSDQISSGIIKNAVQRLRPSHNPDILALVHTLHNYAGGSYGFVSSHASNTFALATFMSFLFKNKYFSISIYFWAALVSYSRIYLGVHYPGDILCGAILGAGLGFGLYHISQFLIRKNYFKLKLSEPE